MYEPSAHIESSDGALDGVTICFVAIGAFGAVWPTWKKAESLADAGGHVCFVGYADVMPDAIADSRHEILAAPRPHPAPTPPTPPELPGVPLVPELPAPLEWRSSRSRFRLIRAIANRTFYRVDFEVRRRKQEQNYQHQMREEFLRYQERQSAYEDALVGYEARLDDYRIEEQAFLDYVPPPWYTHEAHPTLIDAVVKSGASIVHAVDLSALDVAYEAAKLLDARLIYSMEELWVGFVNNPDHPASPEAAAGVIERERELIGEADLVTVTSDQMGERLMAMYGIERPLVIFNSPSSMVEMSRPVGSPLRLVFHGGLSRDRNIDGLIRAVGELRDHVTLDIHGSSRTATEDELQQLIDELDLRDVVHLRGSFAYEDVVDLLASYDIGVMSAKIVDDNFDVALPTKVLDCMCSGLAIAMTDSSAVRAILEEVPFGITVDASSPASIAKDLEQLVRDPDRIAAMKAAAVEAAPRYWWPEQEQKLLEAVYSLKHPSSA